MMVLNEGRFMVGAVVATGATFTGKGLVATGCLTMDADRGCGVEFDIIVVLDCAIGG